MLLLIALPHPHTVVTSSAPNMIPALENMPHPTSNGLPELRGTQNALL